VKGDPEPLEAPPAVPGGSAEWRPEDRILAPLIGILIVLAAIGVGILISR
jgi:hypothetical protein